MKYEAFKNMMDYMRNKVNNLCNWGQSMPTLDEAETAAEEIADIVYKGFGHHSGNEYQFKAAVRQFVRNEILRVCA